MFEKKRKKTELNASMNNKVKQNSLRRSLKNSRWLVIPSTSRVRLKSENNLLATKLYSTLSNGTCINIYIWNNIVSIVLEQRAHEYSLQPIYTIQIRWTMVAAAAIATTTTAMTVNASICKALQTTIQNLDDAHWFWTYQLWCYRCCYRSNNKHHHHQKKKYRCPDYALILHSSHI